jgi:hypothetical protein
MNYVNLCWAPIAFFSLGAAFGRDFIDLSGAKVQDTDFFFMNE